MASQGYDAVRAPCMCVLRMCMCMCMCGRRAVSDRDREGQQPALAELGEHDEQAEAEQKGVEDEVLLAGSGGEGGPVHA